ncbi:MAG TPA: CBS domain-containing protein [Methylomirabilota bacterium]|nr:CBS domain-containing protein [Methylomirabilota bacterium]
MSEFHDEYSESLDTEFRKLEDVLLSDEVRLLAPSEPIRLSPDASVADAVTRMVDNRRAGVVIVDASGRLIGIFTERDLLTRVVRQGRDLARTRLAEVMTADPEALAPDDRICFAINRMHNAGYRTVPLVDGEHRPIGIVTVNDVVGWLARIFPEAILNLRPGDRVKRPAQMDSG